MRRPESPFRTQSSVARRGLLIVAIPLCFQVLLLLVLGRTEVVHEQERREGVRSRQLEAAAQKLLLLLVDSETGMRGYVLTRNPAFAEPFNAAAVMIQRQLAEMESLAAPEQQERIARIGAQAIDALAFHRDNINRVSANESERAIALIRAQRGKERMDRLRAMIGELLQNANAEDARREAASRSASRRQLSLLWLTMLGDLVVALLVLRIFAAKITRRLETVIENERRLAAGAELNPPLQGSDEIAAVDFYFHRMAAQLADSRAQIETTVRELESFSYSVSHDLRAPLRAVGGYAQILEEDYAPALDADGRRYVATLRSESARMGVLIDDLLTFSRLSRAALDSDEFDMSALVAEVYRMVSSQTPDRTIVLTCGELPRASGDRPMIRQVLVNLVSNAVKFSAHRDVVNIEISASATAAETTYCVRDHGAGFDMRFADKLFQIFERLHTADEFEGTGVGLAIVERIVRRHGGRVRAESTLGEGASFYFTLPVKRAAGRAA